MVDAAEAKPGLGEWFTRGEALRRARAAGPSPELTEALRVVDGFLELVDLGLEPPEAFRGGDPNEALLCLLAEALRVAGAGSAGLSRDAPLGAVVEAVGAGPLGAFVPDGESLDAILGWLGAGRLDAVVGLSVGEADHRLAIARAFVRAFVSHVDSGRRAIADLERQRRVRPVAAALVVAALAIAGVVGAKRVLTPPDLAAGKSFTASSAFAGFPQAGVVNVPVEYDVFTHTREEDSPWIRVDLGAVESARTIEIQNRADCCRERALPLVVEVSEDGETWREVGRRDEDFRDWSIAMAPTKLRYVRVTVPRRTFLHLARISVRR
jgi:hypothetical protein